ncbi:hypothetical protein AB4Y40_13350 [Paraburkholderia sp. EG287B]
MCSSVDKYGYRTLERASRVPRAAKNRMPQPEGALRTRFKPYA